MTGKYIKRITLFKVPKEEDIATVLAQYDILRNTAKKVGIDYTNKGHKTYSSQDGQPYIISNEAARTLNASEDRAQGYTIAVQTTFTNPADVEYYDKKCEAHQTLKAVVGPLRTGFLTLMFESDMKPEQNRNQDGNTADT